MLLGGRSRSRQGHQVLVHPTYSGLPGGLQTVGAAIVVQPQTGHSCWDCGWGTEPHITHKQALWPTDSGVIREVLGGGGGT